MEKQCAVYIVTNLRNTVLYIGVTSNLPRRMFEHKEGLVDGFTKKYNCKKLVYYDVTDYMTSAIAREKELKGWKRSKKIKLIEEMNPMWNDLANDF